MKFNKNTYWEGNGKYQKFYEQVQEGKIILSKVDKNKYDKQARQYYRYFNDGDCHYTLIKEAEKNNCSIDNYLEMKVNNLFEQLKNKYIK